jgi:hypothetical protein
MRLLSVLNSEQTGPHVMFWFARSLASAPQVSYEEFFEQSVSPEHVSQYLGHALLVASFVAINVAVAFTNLDFSSVSNFACRFGW